MMLMRNSHLMYEEISSIIFFFAKRVIPGNTPACTTPRKKREAIKAGAPEAKPVARVMRPLFIKDKRMGQVLPLDRIEQSGHIPKAYCHCEPLMRRKAS